MICVGEGEYAIVELCKKLKDEKDFTQIENIWAKSKNKIFKNPLRPLVNLDELPFPDREIFDYKALELEKNGWGSFMATRGCPYTCTYCCNHALQSR